MSQSQNICSIALGLLQIRKYLSPFYTPGMGSTNDLSWVTHQKISIASNHYQSRGSCFPSLKVLSYLFNVFLLLGLHEVRYFKTLLLCHFFKVISLKIISWFSALRISLSIPLYYFRHTKKAVFIAERNESFEIFYFKSIYKRHFPLFCFS